MKKFWSLAVVLLIALVSVGVAQACVTCNGTQTRYEVRNRFETEECEQWCHIVEKRKLERHQYPVGNHCAWGPWVPASDWYVVTQQCHDLYCEPEETPEPEPTDEPEPQFTPMPTPVPPVNDSAYMIFNSEMLDNADLLPGTGRLFFVQTMNPVVGELGRSGQYVENSLCSIQVAPGQSISTYGNPCGMITGDQRSLYWGVMFVPDDHPEQQWFVPAANDSIAGWLGRILPEGQNDDGENAYELDFSGMVCVLGCTD